MSGFMKTDRLYPCVTLVLYYGDEWDGGRNLHDIIDFTGIPKQLKHLVNDYKLHMIEIKKLEDTTVFRTDLKQVLDFIRYSKDKQKLRELVESDIAYQCLDEEACDMMAIYTNSKELLELKNHNKEGERVNMCQAIREMLQDEREEGRAEGRAEEHVRNQMDNIRKMMKNLKITAEQAMDILEIETEERDKYLN